jgi:hypothetical protein
VQNVLFRAAGGFTVVDFEYFGWDDPARMVLDFVCHDASLGLTSEAAGAFLRAYAEDRDLPPATRARFAWLRRFLEVEWLAVYLSSLTEDLIARKRFATPGLDVDAYLDRQIAKFGRRLERVRKATDQVW